MKLVHVLKLMPNLGANDARDDYQRDYVERVRIHGIANEVLVQHERPGHGRQPEQQAEGSEVQWSDIQIGIHKPRLY